MLREVIGRWLKKRWNAQDKHIRVIKGRVNACLPSWRRWNLDDTFQTLLGRKDTPARTHRGQSSPEKFKQIYPCGWGFVQTWVHSPYPDLCKWWAVHVHYGRTSRGDMRKSHRWSSSLVEGYSRRLLMANHEGRLHEICTVVQTVQQHAD